MVKSFDNLLTSLGHVNARDAEGVNSYDLSIDEKRQFKPADGFNTTIAFEGDINSIELVIDMPAMHARHELAKCQHKELKWKNLANSAEGVSTLNFVSGGAAGRALYIWEVPSEICANAGAIEISISFYDRDEETGSLAFAWNTAPYSGLKVEKTMSSVGVNMPALGDILLVDEETHNIIAPAGYNNIICNYGDIGTAEIYFLMNRYLGKREAIDVMDAHTDVRIAVTMNGKYGLDSLKEGHGNITLRPYSAEIAGRKNEGMVLIAWKVPAGITAGTLGPNSLTIALQVAETSETKKDRWTSNTYSSLKVGPSIFGYKAGETEEWDLTNDFVKTVIDDYLSAGGILFDPNASEV